MKGTQTGTIRAAAGRPRNSTLTRSEQLRLAKRAQRARDSSAGLTEVRIKLPAALASRLAFAAQQPDFVDLLDIALATAIVEIERYPQLKILCWNRRIRFLSHADAWSLYERNWRFIEPDKLEPSERLLIDTLVTRFNGGVMHG